MPPQPSSLAGSGLPQVEVRPMKMSAAMQGRAAGRRRHSAARLGPGSDVLGYDTPRSTDHDWGARVAVLVDHGEPQPLPGVPAEFRGWPTEVVVVGIGTFLTWQLGFDPRGGITTIDWLVTPAAVAAVGDRRGGLPRRAGRAGAGAPPAGLVPASGVAVAAGLPVAPDRPGGALPRPGRPGRRPARLQDAGGPAGPPPDAAVPAAGTTLCALPQVAGHRVRPAGGRRRRPTICRQLGRVFDAVAPVIASNQPA
jgi:hypothetical protein